MKRMALISLIIVSVAGLAFAQGGFIGIFGDAAGTDCNLWDKGPGLCLYYVFHMMAPGVTASQWSAPAPSCFPSIWLSDTAMFPVTIGSSQTGVAIGYGACLLNIDRPRCSYCFLAGYKFLEIYLIDFEAGNCLSSIRKRRQLLTIQG